jgi:HEPN domain-containing protein
MNGDDRTEDVQLLIEEAAYRLRWARKYDPGDDPRVLCENAHEAIEAALNTVIVAAGKRYRSSHDLGHLANVAADAGQPLPAELVEDAWTN